MSIPNFSPTPTRLTPAKTPPDRQAWLALGLGLGLGLIAVGGRAVWKAADERSRARTLAQAQAGSLEAQLNSSLDIAEVLGALVRQDAGRLPDFQSLASDLLREHPGVAALALVPGGTITEVAPRLGNENLVGRSLLNDPATRAEALGALQARRLTVSGPQRLARGEPGLVGRLPVFLPGRDGRENLWGFVAVEIRLGETLKRARLAELTAAGYSFSLFTVGRPGQPAASLAAAGKLQGRDYVQQALRARDLELRLALQPLGGWYHPGRLALDALAVLLFSLLVAAYVRLRGLRAETEAALVRAKEQVARAQERFRAFLETMPDALCLTDRTGRIQEVNAQAEKLFGYRRDELVGQMLDKLLPQHLARLQPAGSERTPGSALELSAVRKDGKQFPAEVSWSALPDAAGQESLTCNCIRDVSRQKRAEAVASGWERQWRQFVQDAPFALAVLLPAAGNRVEQLNPRFTALFGYAAEDVATLERWAQLAYPDPAYRADVLSALARQDEQAATNLTLREPVECLVRCKDGTERLVSCATTALGRRSLIVLQELPALKVIKPDGSAEEAVRSAPLVEPEATLQEIVEPPIAMASASEPVPDASQASVDEDAGALEASPAAEPASPETAGAPAVTTVPPVLETAAAPGSAPAPHLEPLPEPPTETVPSEPSPASEAEAVPTVADPLEVKGGKAGRKSKTRRNAEATASSPAQLQAAPESTASPDLPPSAVEVAPAADTPAPPEVPALPPETAREPVAIAKPQIAPTPKPAPPARRRKAAKDDQPFLLMVEPPLSPPGRSDAQPTVGEPSIPKPPAPTPAAPALPPESGAPEPLAAVPPSAPAPAKPAALAGASPAAPLPPEIGTATADATQAPTAADSGAPDLPEVEGLTPADGLLRAGGNRKQYLKLLRQFVAEHAGTAGQIRDLLVLGNSADAARLAHSVSGAAADLGAAAIHTAAAGLERAIRQQADPAGIELLWSQFEQALDGLICELKPALKTKEDKPAAEPAALVNAAQLRKAVNQMLPLLTDSDPGAADCLGANHETFRSAFAPEAFREFEKHVRKGGFTEALDQLKKAAKKHGVSL
jgi:PAS domain S-box-containing protein